MIAKTSLRVVVILALLASAVAPVLASPAATAAPAPAAMPPIDVGSNQSDGVFTFVPDVGSPNTMTIDLSLAVSTVPGDVNWKSTPHTAGVGLYNPDLWLVVFQYSSVTVNAGQTIKFKNHASRAPVVWLVAGAVTVSGTIDLSGAAGRNSSVAPGYAEPGPGGFRGGKGSLSGADSSAGFGPGGGKRGTTSVHGGAGSFGGLGDGDTTQTYGAEELAQLVGGSGGGGGTHPYSGAKLAGGGGGGGAIMIAANTSITIGQTGEILAKGGNGGPQTEDGNWGAGGGGSGGAIRLVSDTINVDRGVPGARLLASGGAGNRTGGSGRIRIEKNSGVIGVATTPSASIATSGASGAGVLPVLSTGPSISIVSVSGLIVPTDPTASVGVGSAVPDVGLTQGGLHPVVIEGRNIPLASATVFVRATYAAGVERTIQLVGGNSGPFVGTDALWTRSVNPDQLNFAAGYTALQCWATY